MTDAITTMEKPAKPFLIQSILKQAYALLNGSKFPIWAGIVLLTLISTLTSAIVFLFTKQNPEHFNTLHFVSLLISSTISSPILAGLFLVGAKRARGETVRVDVITTYYRRFLPLATAAVILFVIREITSGFYLLYPNQSPYMAILSILTLIVSGFLMLTLPLVADKTLSPVQAIITSAKKIAAHWCGVFLLIIIMTLGFLLTYAITLGICAAIIFTVAKLLGLLVAKQVILTVLLVIGGIMSIWIIPYCFLVSGVMYHTLVD